MKKVIVHNTLQRKYTYICTEPVGKHFAKDFNPHLTPYEMLTLGVFGGKYFEEVPSEYPKAWWKSAKLSTDENPHKELNYFGVLASQPRSVWQEKGWIHPDDPHGWFEWYCRYHMGRRHPDDVRQIKRWKAMQRHIAQVVHNCRKGDEFCRRKQRQTLLHWAYDSRAL